MSIENRHTTEVDSRDLARRDPEPAGADRLAVVRARRRHVAGAVSVHRDDQGEWAVVEPLRRVVTS